MVRPGLPAALGIPGREAGGSAYRSVMERRGVRAFSCSVIDHYLGFGSTQHLRRRREPHLPLSGTVDASRETMTGDAHGGKTANVGQASPSDRAQWLDVQQGPL